MRTAAFLVVALMMGVSTRAQFHRQNSQTSESLFTISMMDDLIGVAGGSRQAIARTTDAGADWSANQIFGALTFYCSYYNDTSSGGIAGTDGEVLIKHQGRGESFELLPERKTIRGITFPTSEELGNPRDVLCVGDTGMTYLSNDSGKHWQKIIVPPQAATRDFYDVTYWDDSTWWIVGAGGVILYTEDAGTNWQRIPAGTQHDLYSIAFPSDGTTGWIVGDSTLLYTTDGGDTWLPIPTTDNLRHVDGYDSTGIAVGLNGSIMMTTNLTDWSAVPSGTIANLYGIAITDNIYVTGDSGVILTTYVPKESVAASDVQKHDIHCDGRSIWTDEGLSMSATVRIYDLLGVERERVEIKNGRTPLPAGLPAGVYLYSSDHFGSGKFLVP